VLGRGGPAEVSFIHAQATRIDRQRKQVETAKGTHAYGCLVIATGYLEDFSPIPRAGPGGPPTSITSLQGAVAAADGWKRLLANPRGPVVAAAQGTGCLGAAY
jgi:sulfide:quinone oxidoreductase